MLLHLQPCNKRIQYRPGASVPLADALSRLSPEETNEIEEMDVQIHDVRARFSADNLREIQQRCQTDQELIVLQEIIFYGWPSTRKETPTPAVAFWNYRDELSIEDGLVLKGSRIVIPASMRASILSKLHAGHQGAEKMKLRARTAVFWNGINREIDELASRCQECQEAQPRQQREELQPSEVPPRVWHTLGSDLFSLDDSQYLITADYFSKYPFVHRLPTTDSVTVIKCLKSLFAEQGIPATLRTDNGPQFSSQSFKEFAKEFGFNHITSSPHYPRSNGFIESQVKIVKNSLAKAAKAGQDPALAMLCLRATPVDNKSKSPAELLLGRPIQDNLPRRLPRAADNAEYFEHLCQKQLQQKAYHDRHAKSLPPVVPGQAVIVRNPTTNKWEPATVNRPDETRSVVVETQRGTSVRRNRVDIRSVPPQTSPEPLQEDKKEASTSSDPCTTRSGRISKPPTRLDL